MPTPLPSSISGSYALTQLCVGLTNGRVNPATVLLRLTEADLRREDIQAAALELAQARLSELPRASARSVRAIREQLHELWVAAAEHHLDPLQTLLLPHLSLESALSVAVGNGSWRAAQVLLDLGATGDGLSAYTLGGLADVLISQPESSNSDAQRLFQRLVELARGTHGSATVTPGRWTAPLARLAASHRYATIQACFETWIQGTPVRTLADHVNPTQGLAGLLVQRDQQELLETMMRHGVQAEPAPRAALLIQAMQEGKPTLAALILEHTDPAALNQEQTQLLHAAVQPPVDDATLRLMVDRMGDVSPTLNVWAQAKAWSSVERVLMCAEESVQADWLERHPASFPELLAQRRERAALTPRSGDGETSGTVTPSRPAPRPRP